MRGAHLAGKGNTMRKRPAFKNLEEAVTTLQEKAPQVLSTSVHDTTLPANEREKIRRKLKSYGLTDAMIEGARR
jgi:hypothetical protein